MYCKNCGTLLSDTIDFCPQCGTDLRGLHVQQADSPMQQEGSPVQQTDKSKSRKTPIVVAAVIAVLLIAVVSVCAFMAYSQAQHQKYGLSVSLVCDSDGDSGSSPVPVLIEGTDFEGNAVSQQCLMSMDQSQTGEMPELARGTYQVSITGSPILSDGSLCSYDGSAVSVEVTADGDNAVTLPALTVIAVADTTSDQVQQACETLVKYGMDPNEAAKYKDAAEKRISEYLEQVAAEKAQREAEGAAAKAAEEAAAASAITYETGESCVRNQAKWIEYVWNGTVVGKSGTRFSIDLGSRTLVVEHDSNTLYYRISESCSFMMDGGNSTLESTANAFGTCYAQKTTEMGPITTESAPGRTTAYVYGSGGNIIVETQADGQVIRIALVS